MDQTCITLRRDGGGPRQRQTWVDLATSVDPTQLECPTDSSSTSMTVPSVEIAC